MVDYLSRLPGRRRDRKEKRSDGRALSRKLVAIRLKFFAEGRERAAAGLRCVAVAAGLSGLFGKLRGCNSGLGKDQQACGRNHQPACGGAREGEYMSGSHFNDGNLLSRSNVLPPPASRTLDAIRRPRLYVAVHAGAMRWK